MTPERFAAIARLIRMRGGAAQEAARLVLVDGMRPADAARTTGLSPQGVCSVQVMGIRADESKARRAFLRAKGAIYDAHGIKFACPLAWWTARDVWAYIVAHDLPYHPLYDCETHGQTRETLRNTGWLSTDGAQHGRIVWLREHYPEQYAMLATHFAQVRAYT